MMSKRKKVFSSRNAVDKTSAPARKPRFNRRKFGESWSETGRSKHSSRGGLIAMHLVMRRKDTSGMQKGSRMNG